MTQEEKDLLFKDLCTRLPYGVKVLFENKIVDIDYISGLYEEVKLDILDNYTVEISEVIPYLRPLSSMTKEEQKEFDSIWNEGFGKALDAQINGNDAKVKPLEINASSNAIDWLLKNHFDFHTDDEGKTLIEKGLAIEVSKDNNPYKE